MDSHPTRPMPHDPPARDRGTGGWPELDALTHHIIQHHHRYVREAAPAITGRLGALAAGRISPHEGLAEIWRAFAALCEELLEHMMKEEHVLFPYIDELAAAGRAGLRPPASPFGTLVHPVRVMESEHQLALELVDRLRSLTGEYVPPRDADPALESCYADLARFDADLRQHIELENQVLFPRAIEIENAFA